MKKQQSLIVTEDNIVTAHTILVEALMGLSRKLDNCIVGFEKLKLPQVSWTFAIGVMRNPWGPHIMVNQGTHAPRLTMIVDHGTTTGIRIEIEYGFHPEPNSPYEITGLLKYTILPGDLIVIYDDNLVYVKSNCEHTTVNTEKLLIGLRATNDTVTLGQLLGSLDEYGELTLMPPTNRVFN